MVIVLSSDADDVMDDDDTDYGVDDDEDVIVFADCSIIVLNLSLFVTTSDSCHQHVIHSAHCLLDAHCKRLHLYLVCAYVCAVIATSHSVLRNELAQQ